MQKFFSITLLLLFGFLANHVFANELTHKQIQESYYNSYRYEKSGNYEDAIKSLQLIYKQYPKTYTVNYRLAYLYSLSNKNRNAIEHYLKAIKGLPGALSPRLGMMLAYLKMKNHEEVIKMGYQVLEKDFYSYYGNLRLAISLRWTGKFELAEQVVNKILYFYPSDVNYLIELGLIKQATELYAEANGIMQSVLILDPENVTAKQIINLNSK